MKQERLSQGRHSKIAQFSAGRGRRFSAKRRLLEASASTWADGMVASWAPRLGCTFAIATLWIASPAAAHEVQVTEYRFSKERYQRHDDPTPPRRVVVADRADDRPPSDDPPSIFAYGLYGMVSGAAFGLSAGYLAGRDSDSPRRALTLGSAIGLAGGASLGVGLGMWDVASDSPGHLGYYVARDTLYGTLFGALVGSATGGVLALDSGEGKDVLTGLSIGSLAGGGLGLVVGIVDATSRHKRARREHASSVRVDLAVVNEAGKGPVYAPTVSGTF